MRFCKIRKIRSRRGAPGHPGDLLARAGPWMRQEATWTSQSPSPPPLWLVIFLLVQKYFLYIFPDRPGFVSCDSVRLLFDLFVPGELSANLGAMASPKSPKDKFLVNVINPYLAEVKRHPQTLWVEDGVLHKEDLNGHVKEGSTKARMEEVKQEVFKYKLMIERGVEANYDIIAELKREHEEEMKEALSIISALETKVFELQGPI